MDEHTTTVEEVVEYLSTEIARAERRLSRITERRLSSPHDFASHGIRLAEAQTLLDTLCDVRAAVTGERA